MKWWWREGVLCRFQSYYIVYYKNKTSRVCVSNVCFVLFAIRKSLFYLCRFDWLIHCLLCSVHSHIQLMIYFYVLNVTELTGCLCRCVSACMSLYLSIQSTGLWLFPAMLWVIIVRQIKVRAYAYILSYVKILMYDSKNNIRVWYAYYYVVFEKFNTH